MIVVVKEKAESKTEKVVAELLKLEKGLKVKEGEIFGRGLPLVVLLPRQLHCSLATRGCCNWQPARRQFPGNHVRERKDVMHFSMEKVRSRGTFMLGHLGDLRADLACLARRNQFKLKLERNRKRMLNTIKVEMGRKAKEKVDEMKSRASGSYNVDPLRLLRPLEQQRTLALKIVALEYSRAAGMKQVWDMVHARNRVAAAIQEAGAEVARIEQVCSEMRERLRVTVDRLLLRLYNCRDLHGSSAEQQYGSCCDLLFRFCLYFHAEVIPGLARRCEALDGNFAEELRQQLELQRAAADHDEPEPELLHDAAAQQDRRGSRGSCVRKPAFACVGTAAGVDCTTAEEPHAYPFSNAAPLLRGAAGDRLLDFVGLLAKNAVPSHNPEHSCPERRITDWPLLKQMLADYAHEQLFLEDTRGWQMQKQILMHNPDLDFCPVGLLTFFLTDAHIRIHHGEVGEDELRLVEGADAVVADDEGGGGREPGHVEEVVDSKNSRALWKLLDTFSYYEDLFWHRLDLSMILWSGWPAFRLLQRITKAVAPVLRQFLAVWGSSEVELLDESTQANGDSEGLAHAADHYVTAASTGFCTEQSGAAVEMMNVLLYHLRTLFPAAAPHEENTNAQPSEHSLAELTRAADFLAPYYHNRPAREGKNCHYQLAFVEIVQAFLVVKKEQRRVAANNLPAHSKVFDERQVAELVWWHSMKATEYRRQGLQLPSSFETQLAEAGLAVDAQGGQDRELGFRHGEAQLFTNPFTNEKVQWNMLPLFLGSLPFVETLELLSGEFQKMPWRLAADCEEQEKLLESKTQSGRGEEGIGELAVCPPCGVLSYQVEWFHEQVFLCRLVDDATTQLGEMEKALAVSSPPSSTTVRLGGEKESFQSKSHPFYRDDHVNLMIPYDIERPEEAWAVVLTALPRKQDSDPNVWKKALRSLHVYVTAIRVLARSVLKRARVRRPFLVLHNFRGGESQESSSSGGGNEDDDDDESEFIMQSFLALLRDDGLEPRYVPPPAATDEDKLDETSQTTPAASSSAQKVREDAALPTTVKLRGADEFTDDHSWRKQVSDSWWAKIRMWEMTEFRKIVYLDADMLVLQNVENLFTIDADFALPLYEDSVIGLMVISPSKRIYRHLLRELFLIKDKVDAKLRSLDQSFQHAFWYANGLRDAGYAVFAPDEGGKFLHCNVAEGRENGKPYLQPPKLLEEGERARDYNSSEDHPLMSDQFGRNSTRSDGTKITIEDQLAADERARLQNVRATSTAADDDEASTRPSDGTSVAVARKDEENEAGYKVCVLSLEYHLSVTYPQIHRLLKYPHRHSDSAELVYKVLSRVERHAKVLHWPGEKRKPWLHWSQVARTPYDSLWWQGPIASTQFGFFPPPRRSGSLFMLPDGTSITLASSQTQTASHKSTMVHEILPEKSAVCFYVIDNSGSMGRDDGKKFIGMGMTRSGVSPLLKKGHGSVSRWEEAAFKTMQIAVYNLRRKMRATYYLLNPSTSRTDWIDGVDQVTLDASDCDLEQLASELEKHFEEFDGENKQGSRAVTLLPRLLRLITTAPNVRTLCELLERSNNSTFAKKLHILHFGILHSGNIRGSTPLHSVTNYLQSELQATIDLHNSNTDGGAITTSTTTSTSSPPPVRQIHALPINLNLITDGEPDNRVQFENQLRKMCSEFRASLAIMLTINLCTDDDDVVEYYNELDKKLGNEINGLDVLDDLESEQLEILKAGNSFVTYSEEIHVARMAGCNAVIADAIDEEQLSVFHATKMAREVLGLGQVQVAPPGGVEDVVGEASVGTGPGGAVARRGGGVGLEESGQQSQQQQEHEKDKSLRYQQVAGEQEVPSWYDETEELLQILKSRNRDVYDFYNRGMRPLVNVGKLDSMISWHKRKEGVTNFIGGLFGFGGGKR
eukprot:g8548.t1